MSGFLGLSGGKPQADVLICSLQKPALECRESTGSVETFIVMVLRRPLRNTNITERANAAAFP